ncbi:regulatory protein GemA [Actinobacillus sp. GY-402]|nr:regulatory protein GemA [Actinobacillus sp. GY-402]QOF67425.1 regulatory protein GemA [Actinobacillus sp. GY-402]
MKLTKQKLIQLIHIAKQKLSIDEYSYRAMLNNLTGKQSTTKMTIQELMRVMDDLEAKGFKKTVRKTQSPSTQSAVGKSKIITKIRAIWIEMARAGAVRDSSEQALTRFAQKIVNSELKNSGSNLRMLNLQSLNDYQASRVLERLKQWQNRTKGAKNEAL